MTFDQLMRSVPAAIAVIAAKDGRFVEVNARFAELAGYRPDEMQGRSATDLRMWIDLAERDWIAEQIRSGQSVHDYALSYRGRSGQVRVGSLAVQAVDVEGQAEPMVVAVLTDVTERQRTEADLRARAEQVRTIADHIPALLAYFDSKGCYRFVNQQYEEWFQVSSGAIVGQHYRQVLGDEVSGRIGGHIEQALAGHSARFEGAVSRSQKGPRWVLANYVPDLDDRGQVRGFFSLITDITERKDLEQALRQSMKETERGRGLLIALSRAAQTVQRARTPDQIYCAVGHEISKLGFHAVVLEVGEDGRDLAPVYMTFDPTLVRQAALIAGMAQDPLRFPFLSADLEVRALAEGQPLYYASLVDRMVQALPEIPPADAEAAVTLLGLREAICAPLRADEVMGALLIVGGSGLTEDDVPAVSAFANQAGIALENARLFDQVRRGREQMEILSRRLVASQESERRVVAKELHDEIGQALTGLLLMLDSCRSQTPDAVSARIRDAQTVAGELVERVRDLSLNLRPAMLDDLGLKPALLWFFKRYTSQTAIRVWFDYAGLDRRLGPEMEIVAYRIVQEGLTNAARHAGVGEVTVRVWADQASLHVQVEDHGKGFDAEAALAASASVGLAGMRERSMALGGELVVESHPGMGTQIMVELPLAGTAHDRSGRASGT